jgi:hypothetical protein
MRSLEMAGLNVSALSAQHQQRLQALSPQQKQQLVLRLQQHRQQRQQQQQQQQGLVGLGSGNLLPGQPSYGLSQEGGLSSMLSGPGGPIAAGNSSRLLPASLSGGLGPALGPLNPEHQRHTYGTVTTATAPGLSSLGPRADVSNMFSNSFNDGGHAAAAAAMTGAHQRLLSTSLLSPTSSALVNPSSSGSLLNPMASTGSRLNPGTLFDEGFEAWKAEQTARLRAQGPAGYSSGRPVARGIWANAGLGLGMPTPGQGLEARPAAGLSSSSGAAAAAAAAGDAGDAGRGGYASAAANKISGECRLC